MSDSTPNTVPTHPANASPTKAPNRWAGVAFTIVPFLIYLTAEHITLPTMVLMGHKGSLETYNVVAVGILPWVLAAVIAKVVPDWKHLRQGGAIEHAKLQRATNILGFVIAVFHAASITLALSFPPTIWDPSNFDLCFDIYCSNPYATSPILVFVTLLAGTIVVRLFAEVVTRRGLVNGHGMFFGGWLLVSTMRTTIRLNQAPEWMDIVRLAGNVFICCMLLMWFVITKLRSTQQTTATDILKHDRVNHP